MKRFEKVSYADLNARQIEVFNFQKVAGLLADFGFNCIKLADDWQGADFLAYHKDGDNTLKVQLKTRPTIAKKYVGKDLFVAFRIAKFWYVIEHNNLLALVGEHTAWLKTKSWTQRGLYHSKAPNKKLVKSLDDFKIGGA